MSEFVKVMHGEEVVEIPLEEDKTLLLATIQSQFPSASGLKYRNEETHSMRAVRMTASGVLSAPEESWADRVYLVVTKPTPPDGGSTAQAAGGYSQSAPSDEGSFKRKADDLQNPEDSKKKRQTCYRCGGEGHIAEMCSSSEGARQSTAPECHLCHGRGHMRSRCPNQIPPGVCYKCGVYGHTGRECKGSFNYGGGYGFGGPAPRPDFPPGPGHPPFGAPFGAPFGGPAHDRVCYRCHQPGHQAAACPQNVPGQSMSACFKCGMEGHQARTCDVCYNCKQSGHMASQCPMGRS